MSKADTKRIYALRSFLSYLTGYKLRLAFVLFWFVVSNAMLAVIPLFIGRLIGALAADPVQGHQAVIYVWVLILCSFGHNLTWRLSELAFAKLISPISFLYENMLFQRIIRMPYPYFVDKFTGKISSYITTISQDMRSLLAEACYNYTSQVIGVIAMFGILASVNWQTAVLFAVGIAGMLVVGRYTIRGSTKYEKLSTDVQSNKNAKLIDAIANFVNVKSFRKESREINTILHEQDLAIKANKRSQYWAILFWASMSFFVRDLIWPLAIGINVYLFLHGQLSIAALSTILSTLLIFSSTVWEAVWYVSQFTLRFARVEEAHRYLFGNVNIVRSHQDSTQTEQSIPAFAETLQLKKLEFAYPDKPEASVLSKLSLNLTRGQKLGVVGKSGSGKSTITKLLLGYYNVADGQLLVDGKPVSTSEVANIISYVPQDTTLFHRSIADNIAYASNREVTRDEIVAAAKLAHADEFISKISDGYDALVGERGVKLSVGQRQRIAIARAFLDDKPILILDEATSALDSESEVLVQAALENLWEHKTVIAIAHRLSTLRHMDTIAVMEGGKIIEQGSHKELLDIKGTYAKLWSHQSGGFIEE